MTRVLIALMALLLGGCASQYSISESELENYIEDKVSFETESVRTPLFATETSLNDIKVTLGHKADTMKVAATSKIKISNPIFPLSASIHAEFEAQPYYDPSQKALYLRQLELVKLESEPRELNQALAQITPQAINFLRYFLENQAIYRLDTKQWDQATLAKMTKQVKVTPGYISFVFKE
ncbi:DUF1439 domain-containing protein [Paraferrimonas sedimenticola]|uniref:Lipoprotein n=1 Tax=Paraferrimonas sedimenticola TaxID=375674 RepID=A0AA37RV55_9GAMM|nr:DUF1439 domain-containing protein [Paraferrimonas sedimenticola]GLP95991.1 hypothetical protein GCM10007895_12970 [Paraferrimonas sedimenticola]